ncbi:hypothetical protein LVISKB_1875 [Levilactobacillus brevis KB290]|uniref:Uncharacterized protein n=1 Tax=Levilactobacillus brevis KB290 TaxID=1001583 RepID=M5AGH0_LEVBR|nr:hypothetical protein LVISKB_1875 [Levilactobacillus brevis KB290]
MPQPHLFPQKNKDKMCYIQSRNFKTLHDLDSYRFSTSFDKESLYFTV